jgi:hypothetical protein
MDEIGTQLLRDTRAPLPVRPGYVAREDDEYARGDVADLFLSCEPLGGQRWADVTARRTRVDWARQIKELVDVRSPTAEKIVLVLDNRNTHSPASRYAAFPPAEAKRLADRLAIHHTPKHGSWRTMAEIALSALRRRCLDRRLPDFATPQAEVTAWQDRRNADGRPLQWRFTTDDARIKLWRLYPTNHE